MKTNKNYNLLLIKIYQRKINTGLLGEVMQRMQGNKILQEASKSVADEEYTEKMNKLKEKVEIKLNNEKYETIQENLNESLNIMKELNTNFKNIKEKSVNIEVKIEQEKDLLQENKLDTLNTGLKNIRELNEDNANIVKGDNTLIKDAEGFQNSASSIRKSIFDVEWLQPFLDFMHNHSTLVLTIGSGLVMGGMWYMNNVGIINIGSLLTRLGIQIFSGSAQNLGNSGGVVGESYIGNQSVTISQKPIEGTSTARIIATGFFRELGQKVLKLIDVLIAKMESKSQNYK